MFVDLFARDDRLGANLCMIIGQIIYARHHGLFIKYDRECIPCCTTGGCYNGRYNTAYNESIFMQTLFHIIDVHNAAVGPPTGELVRTFTDDGLSVLSRALLTVKEDLFSYFKRNFDVGQLRENASLKGYTVPFEPSETIVVHLRLNDRANFPDYDGTICSRYFAGKINSDVHVSEHRTHAEVRQFFPYNNNQSPIAPDRLKLQIESVQQKYPTRKVIIVTNPGENLSKYPYESISNADDSLDLYILSCAEVAILSRSTFAFASILFGRPKDVYIPVWGHTATMGLGTKYDKSHFNYFS